MTVNLHDLAAAGFFNASRLPVLFLTLDRNRQWWNTGPLLSSGQRVEFTGSQLEWEYYPGQGIELQVLGTFGKADGLYTAGRSQYSAMRSLLAEMIPLAVRRSGNLVWEYYFHFDGGTPPWVSAMSQGTGDSKRSPGRTGVRAPAKPTGGGSPATPSATRYLRIAHQALSIFTVPPPVGVRTGTSIGARYLQYSFAPGVDIINAFLQSLIGLYDYAHVSGDRKAASAVCRREPPGPGRAPAVRHRPWSLYQPGVTRHDRLSRAVTGIPGGAVREDEGVACTAARRSASRLPEPPAARRPAASAGTADRRALPSLRLAA